LNPPAVKGRSASENSMPIPAPVLSDGEKEVCKMFNAFVVDFYSRKHQSMANNCVTGSVKSTEELTDKAVTRARDSPDDKQEGATQDEAERKTEDEDERETENAPEEKDDYKPWDTFEDKPEDILTEKSKEKPTVKPENEVGDSVAENLTGKNAEKPSAQNTDEHPIERVDWLPRIRNVYELISSPVSKTTDEAHKSMSIDFGPKNDEHLFSWVHIPANNVSCPTPEVIEDLIGIQYGLDGVG
jgi:hypothetical protein